MISENIKPNIIGFTRIRNESEIIMDTLDHLSRFCKTVVVYDDASIDNTVALCKSHPIVSCVIEGKEWDINRERAEFTNRGVALKKAMLFAKPNDWLVYIDADERIEYDWNKLIGAKFDAIKMKLFDVYITYSDMGLSYMERQYVGPEYRTILFAYRFHPSLKYHLPDQREATIPSNYKVVTDGYVKHYGKGFSVSHWEDTCNYYANHFPKYARKWSLRKGRAIHNKSDFGANLIHWKDIEHKGYQLTIGHHSNEKPLNILVTNVHMNMLGGSETYTYTLIRELQSRGHKVDLWTNKAGYVSDILRDEYGCIVNNVKPEYDLILISHYPMARQVLDAGIKGIKIQTCHGVVPPEERPHEYLDYYVSISEEIQLHLKQNNYESEIIYNGVDCKLFSPIHPINDTPEKLYSLSQSESLNIRLSGICESIGMEFEANNKFINPEFNTHEKINSADVVVAIGRGCYESMACGRPVILLDHRPYSECFSDGLLTSNIISESLKNNCSGRRFKLKPSDDDIKEWILNSNPKLGNEMREYALEKFSISNQATRYIQIYNELSSRVPIIHDEHTKVFGSPDENHEFLVSVCVATYQECQFIRQCLESILSQKTNFKFEILIGYEGSTDGTVIICNEFQKKYPNLIKLIALDGGGEE